jgi:coproporphyrinogen III oxidase-like Fe-S oxidoreductase
MSGNHNMHQKLSTADYHAWLDSPLTKALKQSHQTEIDAIVKDSDRAFDLLRRAETEMRYAGWTKYETDNSARNGVYEQIVGFLK